MSTEGISIPIKAEDKISQIMAKVDRQFEKIDRKMARMNRRNIDIDIDMGRATRGIARTEQGVKGLVGSFRMLERQAGQTARSIGRQYSGLNSTLKGAGSSMMLGTAGVGVGAGVAIKEFADYDDAMRTLQATLMETESGMGSLKKQARDLGKSMKFDATEVGSAQNYLAMAGFDKGEILKNTPGLMNLAAFTKSDLGATADMVSNATSITGEDSSQIADMIAVATSKSNVSFENMKESMKDGLSTLGSKGVGFAEYSTLAGIMGDRGIQGTIAGTSMKKLGTRMITPTESGQAWFDRLDFSATDEEGNMRPVLDLVKELQHKTRNMNDETRSAFVKDVFGQEGVGGIEAVLNTDASRIDSLFKDISDSAGSAEKKVKIAEGGIGGSIRNMLSTLKDFSIQTGQLFEAEIKYGIDMVIDLADSFTRLDKETQKTIFKFVLASAVIGPFLFAMGALLFILPLLLSPIGLIATGLGGLALALGYTALTSKDFREYVATEFKQLANKLGIELPTMGEFLKGFGNVMEDIAYGTVDAIVWMVENGFELWMKYGDDVKNFGNTVVNTFDKIKNAVSGFNLGDAIGKGKDLLGRGKAFGEGLLGKGKDLFGKGKDLLGKGLNWSEENLGLGKSLFGDLKEEGVKRLNELKEPLMPLLDELKIMFSESGGDIGKTILDLVKVVSGGFWDMLVAAVTIVSNVLTEIVAYFNENSEEIMMIVNFFITTLELLFKYGLPVLQFIVQFVFDTIWGIIKGVLDIILGLVKIFKGLFTGDWELLWEGVKQLVWGVIMTILNFFGGVLFKGLFKLVKGGMRWIGDLFGGGFGNIIKKGGDFAESLAGKFGDAFDSVAGKISDTIEWAIGKVNWLLEKVNKLPKVKIPLIPTLGNEAANKKVYDIAGNSLTANGLLGGLDKYDKGYQTDHGFGSPTSESTFGDMFKGVMDNKNFDLPESTGSDSFNSDEYYGGSSSAFDKYDYRGTQSNKSNEKVQVEVINKMDWSVDGKQLGDILTKEQIARISR